MKIDREKFLALAMLMGLTGQWSCGASPAPTSNVREEQSWGGTGLGRLHHPGPTAEYYPPPVEEGYYYPPPAEEYYGPVNEYVPPYYE